MTLLIEPNYIFDINIVYIAILDSLNFLNNPQRSASLYKTPQIINSNRFDNLT